MSKIPDFSNEKTRETLKKLGDFVYDPINAARESFRDVVSRPPYELDN